MSVLISPHFSWQEAACHDGTPVPAVLRPHAAKLATQLEIIRERWGKPLVPVSWYRSPDYNELLRTAAVRAGRTPGTAKNSHHMTAGAVDIRPLSPHENMGAFADLVESMLVDGELPLIGGWGIYSGWIHLDIRTKPASGHVAFWRGAGVASEMA